MIRRATTADQNYVADTWVNSMGPNRANGELVTKLLDQDQTRILVAERAGKIIGWVAYSDLGKARALLYVYVRHSRQHQFRLQGVGRALMESAGFDLAKPIVYALEGPTSGSLLARYTGVKMQVAELL